MDDSGTDKEDAAEDSDTHGETSSDVEIHPNVEINVRAGIGAGAGADKGADAEINIHAGIHVDADLNADAGEHTDLDMNADADADEDIDEMNSDMDKIPKPAGRYVKGNSQGFIFEGGRGYLYFEGFYIQTWIAQKDLRVIKEDEDIAVPSGRHGRKRKADDGKLVDKDMANNNSGEKPKKRERY